MVLLSLPTVAASWAAAPASDAGGGAGAASRKANARLIVVRRVQIPEYLQSVHVRFRDSAQSLSEWPAARWAERPEVSLTRHLTQTLNTVLPAGSACDTNCVGAPSALSLNVSYQALDAVREAHRLDAQISWWLTPASGGEAIGGMHQLNLSEPLGDDTPAGQADAMARVNAQLARQIAAQITM